MQAKLSINFMPNAVYEPSRCLRTTLEAAHRTGFPIENIIFETTEDERVHDAEYLKKIFATYRKEGFKTAIDDFGAGYAGLNLLADYQPDIVKLDMAAHPQYRCRSGATNHRRRHGRGRQSARHQHRRRRRRTASARRWCCTISASH